MGMKQEEIEKRFNDIEARKNDPEWLKMTPVERLHAAGLIYALDGEKITLEEYRNGMSPERELKIEKIRLEQHIEREQNRQRAYQWLKERGFEVKTTKK